MKKKSYTDLQVTNLPLELPREQRVHARDLVRRHQLHELLEELPPGFKLLNNNKRIIKESIEKQFHCRLWAALLQERFEPAVAPKQRQRAPLQLSSLRVRPLAHLQHRKYDNTGN